MKHLHWEIDAGPDDDVEVMLNGPANVMLLDPEDYGRYRRGEPYRYVGGLATESPARLTAPSEGRWHVVVDLGGHGGWLRAGVQVMEGSNASR